MTEFRMLVITPDGEVRDHVAADDQGWTILRAMYTAIDCRIVELVMLGEVYMWVDEEGVFTGAPMNLAATHVAARFGKRSQPYLGTAVFTGPKDRDGGLTSLSPEARDSITSIVAQLSDTLDILDTAVDLDNTSRCPKADRCDWCDRREWLQVVTLVSEVGVFCKTICSVCLLRTPVDAPPAAEFGEAMAWVGAHCEHLGIDLDQMHAALREQGGRGE